MVQIICIFNARLRYEFLLIYLLNFIREIIVTYMIYFGLEPTPYSLIAWIDTLYRATFIVILINVG